MENVGCEIMDAQTFYEKSSVFQIQMVNHAIRSAMKYCNYMVKLPTQLYVNIADKLKELGWEEDLKCKNEDVLDADAVSYIYPICVCGGCELPEVTEVQDFVSAREFYDATLKNQHMNLYDMMGWAVVNGFSEVKLAYRSYPAIIKAMLEKGWEHDFWYEDDVSKEERSMFYPKCGFEEGE